MTPTTKPPMLIGAVAECVGVTTAAVRYYERIGLIQEPSRSASGYRLYGQTDVERLAFVRRAQGVGLTLDEIRQVLAHRDNGEQPCG